MDNLRIVIIILVSIVILALLIHGFVINKKERSSILSEPKKDSKKGLDNSKDITISNVSIKKRTDEMPVQSDVFNENSPTINHLNNNSAYTPKSSTINDKQILQHSETTINAKNKVTQSSIEELGHAKENVFDSNKITNTSSEQELKAQNLAQSNENTHLDKQNYIQEEQPQHETISQNNTTKTDVLVLHIKALNNGLIEGMRLESALLQAGFKFGEMNIFHRSKDTQSDGPVIFSLANMTKPGTFDVDNMHRFQTVGVTLFMMIPSKGNTDFNFKLMLQCAQRIANDVHGVVLDDNRNMLTPQKIAEYRERIRVICD